MEGSTPHSLRLAYYQDEVAYQQEVTNHNSYGKLSQEDWHWH
jgi:hypothetical protein